MPGMGATASLSQPGPSRAYRAETNEVRPGRPAKRKPKETRPMSIPTDVLPATQTPPATQGQASHGAGLRGVLAPVLTPFNADGSASVGRFVKHCRALLSQGLGLAAFGTNSEANSLSVPEKRQLLDALLDAGLPAARMMPGTGACALPDTIELTRHAVESGCAGV